ncbi:MAG: GNAT family N-acetyltransferase, partial [Clostridia bacterium]|nr:GNAT family N-acetyltransferase [Clostridia bacterium]
YKRAKKEENSFIAVTENEEFIGLIYILTNQKTAYIFFLAVEEEKRGNGYGTKILQKIKSLYPEKAIILMIEDTTEEGAKNMPERLRRLGFYRNNGFSQLGIKINEAGVKYELLGTDSSSTRDDFFSLMKDFLGKFLFKFIYNKSNFR